MIRYALVVLGAALVSGCSSTATLRTQATLAVSHAWVDQRQVEYITTDISDPAMARAAGVNYVPRLRNALRVTPSVLERVYKFSGGEQISVFPSGPHPVGADNTDTAYSPLWRLVLVTWTGTVPSQDLRSEEAILAAEEAGQLRLEVTDVVVNCPIIR